MGTSLHSCARVMHFSQITLGRTCFYYKCILIIELLLQRRCRGIAQLYSMHILSATNKYLLCPREGCKVMLKYCYVCLFVGVSVHLSVCLHNSNITRHGQTLPNSLCMLPMAVAWSFSGGVAIVYVLLVL